MLAVRRVSSSSSSGNAGIRDADEGPAWVVKYALPIRDLGGASSSGEAAGEMKGSSSTEKVLVPICTVGRGGEFLDADQLGRRLVTDSGPSVGDREGEGGRDAVSPAGVPVRSTAEELEVDWRCLLGWSMHRKLIPANRVLLEHPVDLKRRLCVCVVRSSP